MKKLFLIAYCLVFASSASVAFADSLPVYPQGFDKTGIAFQSHVLKKIEEQRQWYCYTIQYLKVKRLADLSDEMKTELSKPLKFSSAICNEQGKFVGLPGPSNENEKAYVDFKSMDYVLFFLVQSTASLGSNDDLAGGLKMSQQGLDELRSWFSAQTGYSPDTFPHIYDEAKHDWTSKVDSWVTSVYGFYAN